LPFFRVFFNLVNEKHRNHFLKNARAYNLTLKLASIEDDTFM
jgi:hypothetical protein